MATNVIETIFSSKTLVKLLDLFFLNPKNSYYLRQIQAMTDVPLRSLQLDLEKLNRLSILNSSRDGNRRYFQLNKNHYLYSDLKNIVLKTSSISNVLRDIFEHNSKDVTFAFVYGSYVKENETISSDIDICILGDISLKNLYRMIGDQKAYTQREINFSVYKIEDFKIKYNEKNHFVNELVETEKLFIVGTENEFKQVIGSKKAG